MSESSRPPSTLTTALLPLRPIASSAARRSIDSRHAVACVSRAMPQSLSSTSNSSLFTVGFASSAGFVCLIVGRWAFRCAARAPRGHEVAAEPLPGVLGGASTRRRRRLRRGHRLARARARSNRRHGLPRSARRRAFGDFEWRRPRASSEGMSDMHSSSRSREGAVPAERLRLT